MSQENIEKLWSHVRNPQMRSLVDHLGIEITQIAEDSVRGSMPVDHRTTQIHGILHGGASVALAETLASMAAVLHIDLEKEIAVGLEINANHLRPALSGKVHGEARPLHLGRKTQVWQIEIRDDGEKLVCISRCTIAVVNKKT